MDGFNVKAWEYNQPPEVTYTQFKLKRGRVISVIGEVKVNGTFKKAVFNKYGHCRINHKRCAEYDVDFSWENSEKLALDLKP